MDLSILIVSWNTCDVLRDCLRSIYQETREIEFETIVVDNASQDETVEMLRSEFPQTRVIERPDNGGFAVANNEGIRIASGRYSLLLNSDTVVLDGALQKSVAFADAHPEAGVVGCRTLNPDGSLQPTCFEFPSLVTLVLNFTHLATLFPRSRFFGRERMTWWDHDDVREVEVVTGAFMLVRKEAVDAVGGLDEQFFMYAEETDWCRRIAEGGWKIVYTPDATIVHLAGVSSSRANEAMFLQGHGSVLRLIRKHYARLYYWTYAVLTGAHLASRALGSAVLSLVRPLTREADLARSRLYASGLLRLATGGAEGLCVRRPPTGSPPSESDPRDELAAGRARSGAGDPR